MKGILKSLTGSLLYVFLAAWAKTRQTPRYALLTGGMFCLFLLAADPAGADDFGFGFGDEDGGGTSEGVSGPFSRSPALSLGGELSVKLSAYTDEWSSLERIKAGNLGDMAGGKLTVGAEGSHVEGAVVLSLNTGAASAAWSSALPIALSEAFVRAYLGAFTLEGGLRKLSWGRADSFGPLDVINPLDYSDLSALGDPMSIKIARPLIHLSYQMGAFSQVEGVFVPAFQGHRFAQTGRWAPAQQREIPQRVEDAVIDRVAASLGYPRDILAAQSQGLSLQPDIGPPATDSLGYAQAGLRFTTTIGSSDLGVQYYWGNLPRPAVHVGEAAIDDLAAALEAYMRAGKNYESAAATPGATAAQLLEAAHVQAAAQAALEAQIAALDPIAYNRYHQIGLDFARVIGGFNLRAELAANLTSDFSGDDGAVYNPAVVWSLGFDRDLFAGITVNLQAAESIRLFSSQWGESPILDTEAGSSPTSTRITAVLSRKFFRNELELKGVILWGIEDADYLLMPSLIWNRGDIRMELAGGIFGGGREGELGQYQDNHWVKLAMTYRF